MNELQCSDFQSAVSRFLLRDHSIVNIMAKLQDSISRADRAVAKAVTGCGCIEIHASKTKLPDDADLDALRELLSSQVEGQICDTCKDILSDEIGRSLFYLVALCNVFDISLQDVLTNETDKLETLGKYNLI
jgi:hypothetical protein